MDYIISHFLFYYLIRPRAIFPSLVLHYGSLPQFYSLPDGVIPTYTYFAHQDELH